MRLASITKQAFSIPNRAPLLRTIVGREARVCALASSHDDGQRMAVAATGRAASTTDRVGWRAGDTAEPGVNGFLVHPRGVGGLASAVMRLIEQPAPIARMGCNNRGLAEE